MKNEWQLSDADLSQWGSMVRVSNTTAVLDSFRGPELKKWVYLIGSLRNPIIPSIAMHLRDKGFNVFDDWHAAGPKADDDWQQYEIARGHSYERALEGYAAQHTFEYDRYHLDRCDIGVLVLPAGKSGHLELGYLIGQGKPGYILLDQEPERWDVMYGFAHGVFGGIDQLVEALPRGDKVLAA